MHMQSKRFLMGGGIIVLAFLLYAAGAHFWWGGWAETQVKMLNTVGEPLAIGETWREDDLFSVAVEDIMELSPSAPLLDELSADELRPFEEQGCRMLLMTYAVEQLDYPGSFDDEGHYSTTLPLSLQAAAYDEAGQYLGQLDTLPVHGRAPGLKQLLFAPPQTRRIIITAAIAQAQKENEPPAKPRLFAPHYMYIYEKNYVYVLPKEA